MLVLGRVCLDARQESASMAWARAFYALAQVLAPGDRILTGMVEYGANYVAMLQVTCVLSMVYKRTCARPGFTNQSVPKVHLSTSPGSLPIASCTLVIIGVEIFPLKPGHLWNSPLLK